MNRALGKDEHPGLCTGPSINEGDLGHVGLRVSPDEVPTLIIEEEDDVHGTNHDGCRGINHTGTQCPRAEMPTDHPADIGGPTEPESSGNVSASATGGHVKTGDAEQGTQSDTGEPSGHAKTRDAEQGTESGNGGSAERGEAQQGIQSATGEHATTADAEQDMQSAMGGHANRGDVDQGMQSHQQRSSRGATNKIAGSLLEGLQWHDHAMDVIEDSIDLDMHDIVRAAHADTMSSAFSGIEAPHTASCANRSAMGKALGTDIPFPRLLHMIEFDPQNQQELLLVARETGACLFGDIGGFFRPELSEVLEQLRQKPMMCVEVLAPVLASGRAVKSSCFCLTHQRHCCLKTARRHVAGTSCVPYSKRGSGAALMDFNTVYSLCWIGLRMLLQEPDITNESPVSHHGITIIGNSMCQNVACSRDRHVTPRHATSRHITSRHATSRHTLVVMSSGSGSSVVV